jgi:bla regulator protein blaR1
MIPDAFLPFANHLWQSTLFALAAAALALLLGNNRASVRYRLWFAASIKFLVPLSLVVHLAGMVNLRTARLASSEVVSIADGISRPFYPTEALPPLSATSQSLESSLLPSVLLIVWLCGATLVLMRWVVEWFRLCNARRRAVPVELGLPLATMLTADSLEPGIVGVWKPVLMLPEGLREQLRPAQFDAIVTHELCHVQRRDNLGALIHMAVEVLFWFHPVVWWIGSRLVDERERACDEAVLQGSVEPGAYAEGILNVCRFYRERRLLCTPGVTGSDLTKRIEGIMKNERPVPAGAFKQLIVATSFVLVVGIPITLGVLIAGAQQRVPLDTAGPAFEVASIKPTAPEDRFRTADTSAPSGRYMARGQTLRWLIEQAYAPSASLPTNSPLARERVVGGPDWMNTQRYSVEASLGRPSTGPEISRMLRRLLADRFRLKVRVESREEPVYELTRVASPKEKPRLLATEQCDKAQRLGIGGGPGRMNLLCAPIELLADALSEVVGRPVFDNTGLTGRYEGLLEYSPTEEEILTIFGGQRPPTDAEPAGPSVFTALQEQFGLRLVSQRRPVEYLVIESAEKPSEN